MFYFVNNSPYRGVRFAVVGSNAMNLKGGEVFGSRVADIPLPSIMGVFEREAGHEAVAINLRNNRGGGDRDRF